MKCGRSSFSRLVKISHPVSVTRSVCSNWADNLPSWVTAVQSSGQVPSLQVPADNFKSTTKSEVKGDQYKNYKWSSEGVQRKKINKRQYKSL